MSHIVHQQKKLSALLYTEIAWFVISIFLGSLIYERAYHDNHEGNFLINLALVLLVASPILINRFLNDVPTTRIFKIAAIAFYSLFCLFILADLVNNPYPEGVRGDLGILFALLSCGLILFVLRKLSASISSKAKPVTTSKADALNPDP